MITNEQLLNLLALDDSIVEVLDTRQVSDGWEYLIRTNYNFPTFAICWTDGERAGRRFGCGLESNARREWNKQTEPTT